MGFAGVGQVFQRKNGYLALFNNDGIVTNFIEYIDNNSIQDAYQYVKELDDGILIGGWKQDSLTGIVNIFISKIDFYGEKIWEKTYTKLNRQTWIGGILPIGENEYIISGSTTPLQGTPLPQTTNTSKIFAIDSLGNVKWEWETQPSLEELGVGSLFKTQEGNWAYTSARGWYNATYNEISIQPKFIIRDEDFNIIRDDTFGVADFPINYFTKAIELNEGGWLAIGLKPVNYPIPPVPMWYNSFSGWMVRLDNQGDQVWSRIDTAFWSVETGSTNYLYDVVELLSGSIIACGYSRTYEPEPKDWGWLIKVSKDGCIDTLNCAPLNTTNNNLLENKINIYPNPTKSMINIESMGIDVWDKIDIINVTGQTIKVLNNIRERKIDLTGLEDGIYFIRLTKSNHAMTKKIIKRR